MLSTSGFCGCTEYERLRKDVLRSNSPVSSKLYGDFSLKGSGNFANRNRVLDQTNPYIVLNGRAYNPATGTVVDAFNGDTIAMGIVPNATAAMVAPLEADLRAIASAKGVTLP